MELYAACNDGLPVALQAEAALGSACPCLPHRRAASCLMARGSASWTPCWWRPGWRHTCRMCATLGPCGHGGCQDS